MCVCVCGFPAEACALELPVHGDIDEYNDTLLENGIIDRFRGANKTVWTLRKHGRRNKTISFSSLIRPFKTVVLKRNKKNYQITRESLIRSTQWCWQTWTDAERGSERFFFSQSCGQKAFSHSCVSDGKLIGTTHTYTHAVTYRPRWLRVSAAAVAGVRHSYGSPLSPI